MGNAVCVLNLKGKRKLWNGIYVIDDGKLHLTPPSVENSLPEVVTNKKHPESNRVGVQHCYWFG